MSVNRDRPVPLPGLAARRDRLFSWLRLISGDSGSRMGSFMFLGCGGEGTLGDSDHHGSQNPVRARRGTVSRRGADSPPSRKARELCGRTASRARNKNFGEAEPGSLNRIGSGRDCQKCAVSSEVRLRKKDRSNRQGTPEAPGPSRQRSPAVRNNPVQANCN